ITMVSCLVLSSIFALIATIAPEEVIYIFNKDPEIIRSGAEYLRYAAISYPAAAMTTLLCTVLRSVERPWLPMISSAISTVANATMNYILIFPAGLGVKGAAIATCISAWLGLIIVVVVSIIQKNILIAPISKLFDLDRAFLAELIKKASPVIINETLWGLGTVCYNIIFSNMGYEQYAAITIVRTFENITFCFFIGLCNACCVMIGKSVGSGEIREAIRDSKRFNLMMPVMALILGAIVILLKTPLVSIFNLGQQVSSNTLLIAENILTIYGLWIAFRNVSYLLIVGVFRSGGDTSTGMKWEMIILWLFAIPVTYIAAYVLHLPFLAVYAIMYLCEDIPKIIIFMRHYILCKWIKPVTQEGMRGLEEFRKPI
ncbi:MAG: polysaccharide biosynthesis C-terminal domain-containing protein, partial [Clostridia bacterium]|nr:polysaccharide biosynthesis C-terminal domain-containing protein [Clostridia bacterium]